MMATSEKKRGRITVLNTGYSGELFRTCFMFIAYCVLFACILVPIRFLTKIRDYIFRKLMHITAICSLFPLTASTDVWWISVAAIGIFHVLIVLAVLLLEKAPFFQKLFVEKYPHEILINFSAFFIVSAALLSICWGIFGQKYLAIASVMAWGPGDGMAAIVGISFGRHKLTGKHIEGTKTVEGTVAMGVTAFAAVLIVLLLMSPLPWYLSVLAAIPTAVLCAFTELNTKNGWDTVTVPVAACLILSAFHFLFCR